MRSFIFAVSALLVLLPSLLVLFAPKHSLATRALWAMAAFLAPVLTIGLAQLVPMLSNNVAEATQWQRMIGILLAGSGFFIPWVIFASFLNRPAKP